MKTEQCLYSNSNGWEKKSENNLENLVQLVFVFGNYTTMIGFYSYGEICLLKYFEQHCEMHNQTMTITLFNED